MKHPKLAVLMPVFNPDMTKLNRTVESVLASTVPLTLVVVDDGSTSPVSIAEGKRGKHRVVVLRTSKNNGITRALNNGLEWILDNDFDYVARMDSGHTCPAMRFEKQLAFMQKNKQVALVGLQTRTVSKQGLVVKNLNLPTDSESIRTTIQRRNPFVHSTLMMRCSVLKREGGYNPCFQLAQDYELELRLSRTYPLANLPEPVFDYVLNPSGSTIKKRRQQLLYHLRALWTHGDEFSLSFYLGLAETLLRVGLRR